MGVYMLCSVEGKIGRACGRWWSGGGGGGGVVGERCNRENREKREEKIKKDVNDKKVIWHKYVKVKT